MSAIVSVSCPHCGNPVMFNLPPRTLGGKTEFCRKCSKMVTVVFETDRDGTIRSIRLA